MNKKLSIKIIIIWLTIYFIAGCNIEMKTEVPKRPSNVPESAIWVGGPDGGFFVFVKKHNDADTRIYLAKVYYSSGDIAYNGLMRLYPDGSSEFDVEKKESYVGWDGDKLYLSNNRHLRVQE